MMRIWWEKDGSGFLDKWSEKVYQGFNIWTENWNSQPGRAREEAGGRAYTKPLTQSQPPFLLESSV